MAIQHKFWNSYYQHVYNNLRLDKFNKEILIKLDEQEKKRILKRFKEKEVEEMKELKAWMKQNC